MLTRLLPSSLLFLLLPSLAFTPQATAAPTYGDATCTSLVCIEAIKTSDRVTYTLSRPETSQDSDPGFGWIAIGWGSTMANSPMVIAWPNADYSITLSQRRSPSQVQPSMVDNPSPVATLSGSRSQVNGSASRVSFYVLDQSAPGPMDLIWAYSLTNPSSSSPSAYLTKHANSGDLTLDLTKLVSTSTLPSSVSLSVSAVATASLATGKPQAQPATSTRPPLTGGIAQPSSSASSAALTAEALRQAKKARARSLMVAHAAFGGLGAMVFLPLGIVLARLLRTIYPSWVRMHWMVHAFTTLPSLLLALALGVSATNARAPNAPTHFSTPHRAAALALVLLFLLQLSLGAFIHHPSTAALKGPSISFAPPSTSYPPRSLGNWLHPLLGVTILALGWGTVWAGFGEYFNVEGEMVPSALKIVWVILVVLFSATYLAGLSLLRRPDRSPPSSTGSSRGTHGRLPSSSSNPALALAALGPSSSRKTQPAKKEGGSAPNSPSAFVPSLAMLRDEKPPLAPSPRAPGEGAAARGLGLEMEERRYGPLAGRTTRRDSPSDEGGPEDEYGPPLSPV